MNPLSSASTCENHLLKTLIEGELESQASHEHVSACADCRQQLDYFQQRIEESRNFLAPSSLQIQRIRAKVWAEIEPKEQDRFWWQSTWVSAMVLGCFMLLTLMAPHYLPAVAHSPLDGSSVYASADSLENMADQLLPATTNAESEWIDALSGDVLGPESAEPIDEMFELVIPETGEQT